jgi:hypothetical protein
MRFFLSAAAIIAVALSVFAQTSAPADKAEEHGAFLCLVAGRVVTAAEGNPLKSARVALVPEHYRSDSHTYVVTSDSDGHFLLKDVAPGRYLFFATHVGFVDEQYQSSGNDGGAVLALKREQKITDVLFRMTAAAVITGLVNNEDGEPMVRVHVSALRRPTEDEIEEVSSFTSRKIELFPGGSTQTDDRGQYRMFGLKPGEYYICAADTAELEVGRTASQHFLIQRYLGTEYAPVYYPGVVQLSQAQVVSAKAGDEVQADISMHHMKTVEVAGRVMGPDGPAKHTVVMLQLSGVNDAAPSRNDMTDDKGNFKMKGVPPGTYVITAFGVREGIMTGQGRQKIEVGTENVESVIISLGGGTTFQGRITVAGPRSVTFDRLQVGLLPADDGEEAEDGRVNKDGTFEIPSVRDGSYAIHLWGLEQEWYVKAARLGQEDILENGLQVEKGAAGGTLEMVVSSSSAQLEGSVTDGEQAITGARVRILPEPVTPYNRFRSVSLRTDQIGHFSAPSLAPGKYQVFAKSPALDGGGSLKSEPQIVTLSEQDRKTVQLVVVRPKAN